MAVVVVAGLVALAVATPLISSFIASRPAYTRARLDHLVFGLQLWWRNPIAGVGMNNFNLHVSPLDFDGTFSGAPIHNHYLRIAIETGLVGFVLYFGFFAWILRLAYRLSAASDELVAATATALFAGLAATAVYWMDDLFYDPIIRMQIWVSVALIVVLSQIAPPLGRATQHPGGPQCASCW